jgi:hypothetical protein
MNKREKKHDLWITYHMYLRVSANVRKKKIMQQRAKRYLTSVALAPFN